VLHPKDLKTSVADGIAKLLEPIGKCFQENEDWQRITQLAYPDPSANVEKKKKKEKVYHPPPPGKGKNVKPAVEVPQPAAGSPDVALVSEELAKSQLS
jgi:tyrosyl-tRNA synthetase